MPFGLVGRIAELEKELESCYSEIQDKESIIAHLNNIIINYRQEDCRAEETAQLSLF